MVYIKAKVKGNKMKHLLASHNYEFERNETIFAWTELNTYISLPFLFNLATFMGIEN
jgi:hypothetical protein